MMPTFLILLLVISLAGAISAAALGAGRRDAVRKLCLGVTVADLLIALVLAAGFLDVRASRITAASDTYQPLFVPGADVKDSHKTTLKLIDFGELGAVQFYI